MKPFPNTPDMPNLPNKGDTLTIGRQDYVVLKVFAIEYAGTERHIIKLRKPRGRRAYEVVRYSNGMLSSIN